MRIIEGMKWNELKPEEREELLKDANAVDGRDGSTVDEGKCIVDLVYPYSVLGKVKDGEIIIADEAVIYNCEG